jgi:hypothetical protein
MRSVDAACRIPLAIRAALLGGWINCLITDRFTGQRLLEADLQAGPRVQGGATNDDAGASPDQAGAAVA